MNCDKLGTKAFPTCSDGLCVPGDEPSLTLKDVTVAYGKRKVIENVSFSASACSITALIGPSGCGKTSLLSCINRLTDFIPSCRVGGDIRIGPIDVLSAETDTRALRRQVGMVFQKPNPFPLSIWKNLALPLKEHGMRDKNELEATIQKSLEDVGLWAEVKDRLQSSALALSGGQQQRLCIARTLSLKPSMILFDEPCSALDPLSSEIVEDLITKLRSRFSIMIVTHNLAQAKRVSDQVAMFWVEAGAGRLLELAPTRQLFSAPVHPLTRAYLSSQVG